LVLAFIAFAVASAYLTRYCISAANTTMQQDLGFDDAQMGQLMSAFMLGYFLFQLPGGWLGNRFGTRFAFTAIAICWSLCNFWTATASLLGMLSASRFFLGVFQAGMVPVSAKIVKDWIPLPNRGMSSATLGASMSMGGAYAIWQTGWLLTHGYGWRSIFAAYSLVAVVWAIAFAWFFRTDPAKHGRVNQAERNLIFASESNATVTQQNEQTDEHADASSNRHIALNMLVCPSLWGLCVQSFFRAAGYVFFVTWFFAFLEYMYGIKKAEAGLLTSLPLMAVVVGSLSGGAIIDWLMRTTGSKRISRSGMAMTALGTCGLFTLASAWTNTATQLSIVIAIGALFSGAGNPAAWAATIDIGGRHTSIVMGVMNMAGTLSGVILPWVLGNWFKQIRETEGDWNQVIYLHAAFYFIGALAWLAVNSDRGIEASQDTGSTDAV